MVVGCVVDLCMSFFFLSSFGKGSHSLAFFWWRLNFARWSAPLSFPSLIVFLIASFALLIPTLIRRQKCKAALQDFLRSPASFSHIPCFLTLSYSPTKDTLGGEQDEYFIYASNSVLASDRTQPEEPFSKHVCSPRYQPRQQQGERSRSTNRGTFQ